MERRRARAQALLRWPATLSKPRRPAQIVLLYKHIKLHIAYTQAHVYITKGVGKVRINNVPVEMIPQEPAREVILAPLEITGDLRDKIDLSVRVRGGGIMGQASAAATGISRALTGWTKSKKDPKEHPFPKSTREDLRKRITDFDKYLISGDARRKIGRAHV